MGLIGAITGLLGYRLQRRLARSKPPRVVARLGWVIDMLDVFDPWPSGVAEMSLSLGGLELFAVAVRNDGERPVDVVEAYACAARPGTWPAALNMRWPVGPKLPVTLATGEARWTIELKELVDLVHESGNGTSRDVDAGFRLHLSNGEIITAGPVRLVLSDDD